MPSNSRLPKGYKRNCSGVVCTRPASGDAVIVAVRKHNPGFWVFFFLFLLHSTSLQEGFIVLVPEGIRVFCSSSGQYHSLLAVVRFGCCGYHLSPPQARLVTHHRLLLEASSTPDPCPPYTGGRTFPCNKWACVVRDAARAIFT